MQRTAIAGRLRENWFWPLAVLLLALAAAISWSIPTDALDGWEVALLFDVFVTIPLLFVLCYRRQRTAAQLAVRVLALQCLGIWIAAKLVPADSQVILPHLVWLRYTGLAILVLIEIRLGLVLLRLVFKPETTRSQLEASGMPPLLAKVALLEARFWRWIFGLFRR